MTIEAIDDDLTDATRVTRAKAKEGDRAYKIAMLTARDLGLENFVVGVVKDRSPIKAAKFERATMSFGASPAASCAAN